MVFENTASVEDDNPDDVRMSFGDHLEELRSRLIRALLFSLTALVVIFIYQDDVMAFVTYPYRQVARNLRINPDLHAFGTSAGFFAYMQVAFVMALLVSAPAWMYQIWKFISVGLYQHERNWAYRFAPLIFGLFGGGVAFGYSVLIPMGLEYLLSFGDPSIVQNWIGIDAYLSMFAIMTLVLGLMFQLPVVMALLAKLGMVGVAGYRAKRRYFIFGTFIVSAIVTPPDYVSQLLMAFPTLALYELGIFLAWIAEGKNRSAIQWKVWRKRLIASVVIAGVLYVFSDRIRDYYAARKVAGKIVAKDEGQSIHYIELFRECASEFGFKAKEAYRLRAASDRSELWCVWNDSHAVLCDAVFKENRITKMSHEGASIRFMLNQSAQSVTIDMVDELDGTEFLPTLLNDFRYASSEQKPTLWRIVDLLIRPRPDGVPPFSESATPAQIDAAVEAWEKWWRSGVHYTYRRAK